MFNSYFDITRGYPSLDSCFDQVHGECGHQFLPPGVVGALEGRAEGCNNCVQQEGVAKPWKDTRIIEHWTNLNRNWYTDWWFGTCFIFLKIGNVIIPVDFHIFQSGGPTTNQYMWQSQAIIIPLSSTRKESRQSHLRGHLLHCAAAASNAAKIQEWDDRKLISTSLDSRIIKHIYIYTYIYIYCYIYIL